MKTEKYKKKMKRARMFHEIQIYIKTGCSRTLYESLILYGGESKVFELSSVYCEVIPKNVLNASN